MRLATQFVFLCASCMVTTKGQDAEESDDVKRSLAVDITQSKAEDIGCHVDDISDPVWLMQINLEGESSPIQTMAHGEIRAPHVSCEEGPFEIRASGDIDTRFNAATVFVDQNNLTFLEPFAMELHKRLIDDIEVQGLPGVMVETGVAAGGSALIFTAIKRKERCLHLYDTFEGMPPPSDKDGADVHQRYEVIQSGEAGENYYGYNPDLLGFVKDKFVEAGYPSEENGVQFHKGLFQDTFHPDFGIAYAHLDGDWYESTYVVLDRATPKLVLNGIVILDDTQSWSGARDAVNDFFGVNVTGLAFNEEIEVSKDGKTFLIRQHARLYFQRTT